MDKSGQRGLFQKPPQVVFFFYILILIYFFKYETIVRSSAWSFGHSYLDPGSVIIVYWIWTAKFNVIIILAPMWTVFVPCWPYASCIMASQRPQNNEVIPYALGFAHVMHLNSPEPSEPEVLGWAWTSLYMDGTAVIFFADLPTWGVSLGPKLQPRGGFFEPRPFLIFKKFTSRSI